MNDRPRTVNLQPETTRPSGLVGALPLRIGRYGIERELGQGGFGVVYLAFDEQLSRPVAIKVPHSKLVARPEDADAYLTEARTVANLDHPNIVPVHDVGSTDDFPCYVVSKYIDGTDLASQLKQSRMKLCEAVELVATVAEVLHYAHRQGVVHRDVKPRNILIDKSGKPFVADFGLALREQDAGKGPRYAGTPAYMSPEQARGEGHRVDGRSDIFSLGVVFYEILVGRKPFREESLDELLEQITNFEPRPPRQHDDQIPKEVDRICLKALSKRASERYSTARDMAEELRQFLAEPTVKLHSDAVDKNSGSPQITHLMQPPSTGSGSGISVTPTTPTSSHQFIRIVPKGLRAFDAHDSDFFLELLPGPRDRNGLPESIRFWKTRIEEKDADNTFTVGLIYGPSGCGKSSLVKAGLLPRLSDDVIAVYIEATGEETEKRLLNGLRKRCPALPENLSLKDTLAALRRGQGIPQGKKVVIVLDQFEQWLHAKKDEQNTELVQALRQCDGGRVQCIIMVRDDFWMAVTRFLTEMEIELLQGKNCAAADLFDMEHARKVLAAFGRAFGQLPEIISETSKDQKEFLNQAVSGLAQERKVVCVRLALFADMMKGKTWTPETLKEVGGTEGVGVTFLEETFASPLANPNHRFHQKAARAVLKALLSESGTDIEGQMKSYEELLESSGYGSRSKNFDDLIRMLDSEIRLITPTDPEGVEGDAWRVTEVVAGDATRYYQLTHDYLVHSLREWLTRKQKETRRGRAELLLADRAGIWNARRENRQLPSLVQWFNIRCWTQKRNWTPPQRKMMAKAGRVHAVRGAVAAALLIGMTFAGISIRRDVLEERSRIQAQIRDTHARELVESLLKANIAQVPAIISDLTTYREWADPELRTKLAEATDGTTAKLVLALAMLQVDDSQIDYLREQLPTCTLEQFPVVRKELLPHKDKVTDALWQLAQDDSQADSRRFQAAAALAEYAPDDQRWQQTAPFVAQYLTTAIPSVYLQQWRQLFQTGSKALIAALTGIHADRGRSEKQREAAVFVLSDYLRDQPLQLTDVILVADELAEYSPLLQALKPHAAIVKQPLLAEMGAELPNQLAKTNDQISEADQQLRDAHWKRQSLAAVTLVNLGNGDEVWPMLQFSPDPSLRSFIIHYLGKLGADYHKLAARLEIEGDVSIRRALVQSLGGLDSTRIPPTDRALITTQLQELYVNDPDSGIHGSASWTLRKWGVELAELPLGEPVLSEEKKTRLAEFAAEVETIRQRIAISEQEFPGRQAAWERKLKEQPGVLHPSLSEGLVAHYPLDETEGNESANAVNGQPGGAYAGPGQPEWVPGVIGHAVRLNGEGGHFTCGEVFRPEWTDTFSYGCWFLSEDDRQWAGLLAKMDDDNRYRGFDLWLEQGHIGFHLIHQEFLAQAEDRRLKVMSDDPVPAGSWQHVMMTYDGSSEPADASFYVNGRISRATGWGDLRSETIQNSVPLHIGMRKTSFPFRGLIDDVRIYNRRLSDKDVHELYEAGVQALTGVPSGSRTPEQQALLTATYRPKDEPQKRLQSQLIAAETALRETCWNSVRHWYVNDQGQTMVVIPLAAADRKRQIAAGLAISSHEVTVAEFRRFRKGHGVEPSIAPTDNCPVHFVSWYDAAAYCNWLSEQEGIPEDQWVYQPNDRGQFADGMTINENWSELQGYRLPSEEEWDFACRAGTSGSYGFGEPVSLLKQYGSYGTSSLLHSFSVESLLPNEAGLFDSHGNVNEWSQNRISGPLSPAEAGVERVCGGSFDYLSSFVRSASRFHYVPTYGDYNLGFRLARTLSLDPSSGSFPTPNSSAYAKRGERYARTGELTKAAANLGHAYELNPENVDLAQDWAYLLYSSGNLEAYRAACVRFREHFGSSDDGHVALILARILILSPNEFSNKAPLVPLAEKVITKAPNDWWSYHVLAGAYLRDGKYDDALHILDDLEGRKLVPESSSLEQLISDHLNNSVRAIALIRLKRVDDARRVWSRLEESCEEHLKPTPLQPFGEVTPWWWNWYPIKAFRQEAEELLRD